MGLSCSDSKGRKRVAFSCDRRCPYHVTERYRKNPPDRQGEMRAVSHVARRFCAVDGGDEGKECRIRPDDERLIGLLPTKDRFV